MRTKTPPPVKQPRPKPKKTPVPDDKRLISFRIAHAVADPDAASRLHLTHDAFKPLEVEAAVGFAVVRPERLDGGGAAGVAAEVGERVPKLAVLEVA